MRTSVVLTGFVAASLLAGAPAMGQARASQASTVRPGKAFEIMPYAGYMRFGDYLKGPLGISLSSANGPLYGAQVGVKLAPNVSLIGNGAYSAADIQVGIPFIGGVSVGQSKMFLYDAGLELSAPSSLTGSLPFVPFVQAGAGAMHYEVKESIVSTKATNFAGNVGLGVDIPLGSSLGLRIMAKDYIGKFDFKDATGLGINGQTAHNWALTGGLRLSF